jgi:hypothetical protein
MRTVPPESIWMFRFDAGRQGLAPAGQAESSAVPDLRWEDVQSHLDPGDGVLPDCEIAGTTAADWQRVFELVRVSGWRHEYAVLDEGDEPPRRLPDAAVVFAGAPDGLPTLKVWPVSDAEVIFRLFDAGSIDFDLDLREWQGQERLDHLCEFLTALGRAVGRPLVMTAEGSAGPESEILRYDPAVDRVVLAPGNTG